MRLTLFSGPGCHACQLWEELLQERGLDFTKLDILQNLGAREYILKRHRGVVPVLLDEDSGREFEGFQQQASERFLRDLMEEERTGR